MSLALSAGLGALYDRLRPVSGLRTLTDHVVPWSEVPADAKPWLGLGLGSINRTLTRSGEPGLWRIPVSGFLYVQTQRGESAQQSLALMLEQIITRMDGDNPMTGRNDLGLPDYVHDCRIEGEIETDEGMLGENAVAIIPFVLLMPDRRPIL